MGTAGNGLGGPGGNEMAGSMAGNGAHPPHATEYTLQGVMRFLQTEWHRHERDRNAWEIEKQEMKGRIASLEGAARRADATQKALKKYVAILENKVKHQAEQRKAASPTSNAVEDAPGPSDGPDRAAGVHEKSRAFADWAQGLTEAESADLERTSDDEGQRSELKSFLDQCQAEFTYLMVTPANPLPPRESPPLPLPDELRGGEFLSVDQQREQYLPAGVRSGHGQVRELTSRPAPAPSNLHASAAQHAPTARYGAPNPGPQSAAMVRDDAEAGPPFGGTSAEWPPAPLSAEGVAGDPKHTGASGARESGGEATERKLAAAEADGWDFHEGTFSDGGGAGRQATSHHRPDTDVFPAADELPRSPERGSGSRGRKSSLSRRRSAEHEPSPGVAAHQAEAGRFQLRFGLRGHLDAVRSVLFSGGGSPAEPEICTAGDDGLVKRFHLPRHGGHAGGGGGAASDLDVQADFTHRGHQGAVLCLASWSPSPGFATGGRAPGDGWLFSGGRDTFVRVWERGRVDPKATLDGHTDAVWALCVLPGTVESVFGRDHPYGPTDRILLASGSADGTVRVWAVSVPPRATSPQPPTAAGGGRRGGGGGGRVRNNSISSGSGFPSSPQATVASQGPFRQTLVHTIVRPDSDASPTCIAALDGGGQAFVVSYSDAAVMVYDTRSGEATGAMASLETYDGTPETSVNSVVAAASGPDRPQRGDDGAGGGGPTGGGRAMAGSGVEGIVLSGHEDRYIRLFDANSGQCTYSMLAHPAAISSLSLGPGGRELVSAGHDASLRFWSLEKRSCTQEITSHRVMRGEGVCTVVWSQDGRWVVSGGGDGVVKVFAR